MSSFGISAPNFESSGSDFNRGDHVLKPGAGIVMRPSWTKSDPTVIRPFPCIEGDSFQPARYSEHAYSKWFSDSSVGCKTTAGQANAFVLMASVSRQEVISWNHSFPVIYEKPNLKDVHKDI